MQGRGGLFGVFLGYEAFFMTSAASGCSFHGNAFHSPRSAAKNRKMFVVVARVNHNNKCGFHYAYLVRC
jgi:hypothetical protein